MLIRFTLLSFVFLFMTVFSPSILSLPNYGMNVALPLYSKEPNNVYGLQVMVYYDPQTIKWRQFNIYFDAGISQFWVTNVENHTALTTYAISPVIHYVFKKHGYFTPFLNLSIGAAYLNHTRIDNRNLGIHFAFQDRLGLGTTFGSHEQFSVGLQALHYSNAGLAENNSGLSVPLELSLGYQFN